MTQLIGLFNELGGEDGSITQEALADWAHSEVLGSPSSGVTGFFTPQPSRDPARRLTGVQMASANRVPLSAPLVERLRHTDVADELLAGVGGGDRCTFEQFSMLARGLCDLHAEIWQRIVLRP